MSHRRQLEAALGYLELGLLDEAMAELEGIALEHRTAPETLSVWLGVYHAAEKWTEMQEVARHLVQTQPQDAQWWISLAFATRRAECLEAAQSILLEAEKAHPDEPIIQFNLGCYACQLGDTGAAQRRIRRAIELDGHCRALALADPDLAPMRESLEIL